MSRLLVAQDHDAVTCAITGQCHIAKRSDLLGGVRATRRKAEMSINDRPDTIPETAEPRLTSGRRRFLAGAAAVAGGVALAPSLGRAEAAVPMSL
jgi:hypothetical protein